ncbi:hypothetical protein BpHYR1_011537 [Brachionus plicatilis]|uniref:Uncharacterized protein n=1 Tax=Brachionus plicatilis TaxID=10195 RepID=A0A3M7QZR5_BRAPC|nr:hypothetical protein BpHYR1_011537 [Brachionus plicatilis]
MRVIVKKSEFILDKEKNKAKKYTVLLRKTVFTNFILISSVFSVTSVCFFLRVGLAVGLLVAGVLVVPLPLLFLYSSFTLPFPTFLLGRVEEKKESKNKCVQQ